VESMGLQPARMQKKGVMQVEVVVIGAGTVGAAIGYGLAARGVRVLLLDGGDRDVRAACANFGLVWLQGKGTGMPAYQELTRDSIDRWPRFDAQLHAVSTIDLQYEHNGGLALCLSEADWQKRQLALAKLDQQSGAAKPEWEMLDRGRLERLLPRVRLGPEVVGASFGRRDGHVNPLRLLAALHQGILRHGGELCGDCPVRAIAPNPRGGFTLHTARGPINAPRVVVAAGLGSRALAAEVGLTVPIKPQRGQILVTERLESVLPLPISGLRQTREGTVMIGTTHENVGADLGTTTEAAAKLSAEALRRIPALRNAILVRQWSGLRILTPDTYPIYAQSPQYPGAFVTLCHSGVTLAAFHATTLAQAIAAGRLPASLAVFHPSRFDVSQAA
jgi:glycine/D-amino acid oxidase-like deaminating enzyme